MEPQDKGQSVYQAMVESFQRPTVFHASNGDIWVTDLITAAREVGLSKEDLMRSMEILKDMRFVDEPDES